MSSRHHIQVTTETCLSHESSHQVMLISDSLDTSWRCQSMDTGSISLVIGVLTRKCTSYMIPHLLSHYASKFVNGFSLWVSLKKYGNESVFKILCITHVPRNPRGHISTRSGIRGQPTDVINCNEFFTIRNNNVCPTEHRGIPWQFRVSVWS